MRYRKFHESFQGLRERSPIEEMRPGRRYLVISDLRMGDGGESDELQALRDVVEEALASWYLENDFILVLNGDTENLRDFWLKDIRTAWADLYAIFDRFAARARLRKILGERDLGLLRKPRYPYPCLHGLRLARENLELFRFADRQHSHWIDHALRPAFGTIFWRSGGFSDSLPKLCEFLCTKCLGHWILTCCSRYRIR